jgi:hypothetical protein
MTVKEGNEIKEGMKSLYIAGQMRVGGKGRKGGRRKITKRVGRKEKWLRLHVGLVLAL